MAVLHHFQCFLSFSLGRPIHRFNDGMVQTRDELCLLDIISWKYREWMLKISMSSIGFYVDCNDI